VTAAPLPQGEEWPVTGPAFPDAEARRVALTGRVAVITGASRGLGAGMAARFASAGLHLGLCARHRPELASEAGVTASVDVTDAGALHAFADAVLERFGRIDLWVNNAGVLAPIAPLADAPEAEIEQHVAVNVTAVLLASRLFARQVRDRQRDGVLVNISSGAALRPYEGWAPYCAAKAAVDMLTEVLDVEGRRWGLRAFAVAPGVVDTDMQLAIRAAEEDQFPEVGRFRSLHAEGAFNSPAWVADHLLDLAFGAGVPDQVRFRVPPEPRPQFSQR
jgi:benzil reductase ((S)-benzoin forming)